MGVIKLQDSINKSYRRQTIASDDFNRFLSGIKTLLANVHNGQSEDIQRGLLTDFLNHTFYSNYSVGPAEGNIDLAIRLDNTSASNVAVLFEIKSTSNSSEMISLDSLNRKALHEAILYYFNEREKGNNDIKYIVITNLIEFFIFDAVHFERLFYKNTNMRREYLDFIAGRKTSSKTDSFYKEIAHKYIGAQQDKLEFTHFSLADYKRLIRNGEQSRKLTDLYRIFSPTHLLKLPFLNDSNSLNSGFYKELLHIIGLAEHRINGKVTIGRVQTNPNIASLLENAINIIRAEAIIPNYIPGAQHEERLFNAGMELVIIWINRILFLKLLEAQLVSYHRGDTAYRFLTYERIADFDTLNRLFFQVLGIEEDSRTQVVKEQFPHVPYLNSSLFEVSKAERDIIKISNLSQTEKMPLYHSSILYKDERYSRIKELPFLEYLFAFLDAYNFANEGNDEIREQSKTLINASVLGLIFEKINGYKDGSFFTPGCITSYMCRESLRRTVVDKFNRKYRWNLTAFDKLQNTDLTDLEEANAIINSITICDPAVGSGHFLVSALNELIKIKYDLRILLDTEGKRILKRDCTISIETDDLVISEDDGELWIYNPKNEESRRIQQAIFKEKQTIIENCLFGVDINPNSVNICRLRLWIELLKNAYYTPESGFTKLRTLPNIDINIKCGNSLLNQHKLTGDIEFPQAREYRELVHRYKSSKSKEDKHELEQKILSIKNSFTDLLNEKNPVVASYRKAAARLALVNNASLFDNNGASRAEQRRRKQEKSEAEKEYKRAQAAFEKAKTNLQFRSGFEWRLEFPEVLDDKGNYDGFDVVIGNPPYGSDIDALAPTYEKIYPHTSECYKDIYKYFFDQGFRIIRDTGILCYISPNTYLRQPRYGDLRRLLLGRSILQIIDLGERIFTDAVVPVAISLVRAPEESSNTEFVDLRGSVTKDNALNILSDIEFTSVNQRYWQTTPNNSFINETSTFSKGSAIPLDEILTFKDAGINYQRVKVGLSEKGKSNLSKRLLYEGKQESPEHIMFWKGSDIDSYFIAETTERFVRPDIPLANNERVILNDEYFAVSPKLIWRQTAPYPIAAVDNRGIWFGRSIQAGTIKPEYASSVSYEYLCGIINSDSVRSLYEEAVKESVRVFPQVKLEKLRPLPIIIAEPETKSKIEELVRSIIRGKALSADTSLEEKELNTLVATLYENEKK